MQYTLQDKIFFKGTGLHSGMPVTMTVAPAPAGNGITLTRTDIKDKGATVKLGWEHSLPSELCTLIVWQLSDGSEARISTVEHILSALRGANIDNAHILVDGPEIPIMDGSAIEFYQAIARIGAAEQAAPSRCIRICREVKIEKDGKYALLRPATLPSFRFEIDFDAQAIGRQTHALYLINGNYAHDIAAARTFCTLDTVSAMQSKGLALGGSLDNAVVVDGDRVLNPEGLRFPNECVRHKILDAIGDLYLAGAPILGAYEGFKAGHAMHTMLLREVFANPENYQFIDGSIDDLPFIHTLSQSHVTATQYSEI